MWRRRSRKQPQRDEAHPRGVASDEPVIVGPPVSSHRSTSILVGLGGATVAVFGLAAIAGIAAPIAGLLFSSVSGGWESIGRGPFAIEQNLPIARRLAGFQGVLSLIDRATGKSITITLWQDEDAMRASEEAANRLRAQGAEAAGESVVSVERYEVAFSEMSPPAA